MILTLALARAADLAACPPFDPGGLDPGAFEHEVVGVDSRTADLARDTDAAAAEARRRLVARLAPGLPEVARQTLERRVKAEGMDPVPKRGGQVVACGAAFVESAFLDRVRADAEALDAAIHRLSGEVRRQAGTNALLVPPVQTSSGCPAGPLGRTLADRTKAELARDGARLGTDARTAWRLLLEVNPEDADGMTVIASLWPPGSAASVELPGAGFRANPWVLVADVEAALATARLECIGNDGWQLDATGRRPGAGGLQVDLGADTDLGALRPGQAFQLEVRTTAPARVQVYSLSPDGRTWLAFPYGEPGGHRVFPEVPWTGIDAVADPLSPPRPEQFLAVAVPVDRPFSQTASWAGFCQAPGRLGPEDFPADAAMHMVRFVVDAAGAPASAPAPIPIPECGTGRTVEYRP